MKILHLFKTSYPDKLGGIEHVMQILAEGLKDKYDVDSRILALSPNISKTTFYHGPPDTIKVPELFQISSTPFPQPLQFYREFKTQLDNTDILHCHFPWPVADFYNLLINRGIRKKPLVISYQSDVVKQKFLKIGYKPIMQKFLNSADRVIATSNNYIETSSVLSSMSIQIPVIPNGLPILQNNAQTQYLQRNYRERFGKCYFLFLGAPRYYKGLSILVDAAQNLPATVIIAGDGPELSLVKTQARKTRSENVKFIGSVSETEKAALIRSCCALVLPSVERSEAYGLVLVEAASAGKPLISTSLGTGTTFINKDGHNGIVVPPRDSLALHKAMITILENPAMAKKFGLASIDRYQKYFTKEQMVDSYYKIYTELKELTLSL